MVEDYLKKQLSPYCRTYVKYCLLHQIAGCIKFLSAFNSSTVTDPKKLYLQTVIDMRLFLTPISSRYAAYQVESIPLSNKDLLKLDACYETFKEIALFFALIT